MSILRLAFGLAGACSAPGLAGFTAATGVHVVDPWWIAGSARKLMRSGASLNVGLAGGTVLASAANLWKSRLTEPLASPILWTSDAPHLSGNFAPIGTEGDADDLQAISGRIPWTLKGVYMRNGPNPRYQPASYTYPLEGDGWCTGSGSTMCAPDTAIALSAPRHSRSRTGPGMPFSWD